MRAAPAACVATLAAVLFTSSFPPSAQAKPRVFDTTDAGMIYRAPVTLRAGKTYRMWTRSTSSGGDTVLHLYAQQLPDTTYGFVTSNDDWATGGCAATPPAGMIATDGCIEYTNTHAEDQPGGVLVHAYRREYSGTTMIIVQEVNGPTQFTYSFPFGGDAIADVGGDTVEWDQGERLDFAYTPGGLLYPRVIALRGTEDPIRAATKNADGSIYAGLWGQPRMYLPVASGAAPPSGKGGPIFVVGSSYVSTGYGDGSARLYLNDFSSDQDGDGLGDALETALGTSVHDTDTDDDGFRDELETIGGAHHPDCAAQPEAGPTIQDPGKGCAINLRSFGADPNVVNIFVTLMWMEDETGADPIAGIIGDAVSAWQDAFATPVGAYGDPKTEIELLVDYGAGAYGELAVGGPVIDYQDDWCVHGTRHQGCPADFLTYAACAPGLNEPDPCTGCGGPTGCQCVRETVNQQGVILCLPRECGEYCERYGEAVTDQGYDPHAPWNINDAYWAADPLFPLNRRGLGIPYFIAYNTTVDPSFVMGHCSSPISTAECSTDYPDDRPIYPGFLESRMEDIDGTTSAKLARHLMHEVGHALGLDHATDPAAGNRQPNHVSVMNYYFNGLAGVTKDGVLDYGGPLPVLRPKGALEPDATTLEECVCEGENAKATEDSFGTCNARWYGTAQDGECYYGGLEEWEGIGEDTTAVVVGNHEWLAKRLTCVQTGGPPVIDIDDLPQNIDWNNDGSIAPEPTTYDKVFANFWNACPGKGAPVGAIVSTFDEWAHVLDRLPTKTQGTGIPAFVDASVGFDCPDQTTECCAWCVPDGSAAPEWCGNHGSSCAAH